ncbi:MAG: hypothetical protein Q8787_02290 [Sweet potato little leaf phytoplasma]|nr:hypothetical protein [Sweet potato little leaf phytoplasma]
MWKTKACALSFLGSVGLAEQQGKQQKGKNLAAHSPKSNLEPDAALGSGA